MEAEAHLALTRPSIPVTCFKISITVMLDCFISHSMPSFITITTVAYPVPHTRGIVYWSSGSSTHSDISKRQ